MFEGDFPSKPQNKLYGILDLSGSSSGIEKIVVMATSKEEAIKKLMESDECDSIPITFLKKLEELGTDVVSCSSCY